MSERERLISSSSASTSSTKTIKVVMMGDSCAGKSAILERFISNTFDDASTSTIGMDFFSKQFTTRSGKSIKLQVWDTAGQERFRQLMPSYIREAGVAILVFDLSNERSFANLESWVLFMRRQRGDKTQLVLVGNKSDNERQVDSTAILQFLIDHEGVPYIETSARTGENLFETIANLPFESEEDAVEEYVRDRTRTIRLSVSGEKAVEEERAAKTGCSC
ncbi:hypothetical protein PRIPAC_85258 [Pristionchus pacificus]|uniref:ADP ribosylation factor n=1 Tax=Pristionchus pacificus TaxID=54126 RepID=A0A454Y382_PRIPA|nr:hypothetical protein PRIPAC_85258 [Pristionchus pacificus]|eukprot:PDM67390.1 ADP ribosylation factor [Pristionchus pacificus]